MFVVSKKRFQRIVLTSQIYNEMAKKDKEILELRKELESTRPLTRFLVERATPSGGAFTTIAAFKYEIKHNGDIVFFLADGREVARFFAGTVSNIIVEKP